VIRPGQQGADVLVANYHAPEETEFEKSIRTLERFGVSRIRVQREVFNAELYFSLLTLAKMGDLNRMTQFQSCPEEDRTGQLLTYPVLMAHDVAGYGEVLVGEDQEQHLHYARKLLRKYNKVFNKSYVIPSMSLVGGRIKDLREPDKKMSKSQPQGCVFLDDKPDDIRYKIRKATATDAGLENLSFLYREFVGPVVPSSNLELKEALAEAIVKEVA